MGTEHGEQVNDGAQARAIGKPSSLARAAKLTAWLLPAVLIGFLAYRELTSGRGPAGSLSVAAYRAEAQLEATPAPDFQLDDLQGSGQISLADLRGDVAVINFWASWCGPCREEAPALEHTWRTYRVRGVRFLGVDEIDNAAAARTFVRQLGLTYPSVFDPAGRLAAPYRLYGLPTTVIVDPGGQIVYRFTGFLTEPALSAALDDVLSREET